MHEPDFTAAVTYALGRLQHELSPDLCYHNLWHTRSEVVPSAERLAKLSQVDAEDIVLLRTAAYYHDIGFVEQREGHELVGARIAAEVLPGFGYTSAQVEVICNSILATHLPQQPHSLLEQLLADADLEVLGRPDFLERNTVLRNELAAGGSVVSDKEWYCQQLAFLQGHRYWTAAARTSYDSCKSDNSLALAALLEAAT